MPMALGASPTAIAPPAVLLARSIGVTLSVPALATNAVLPSGVMAIAPGAPPTRMAGPAVLFAVVTGVTVPAPVLTT